ncbi:MAG: spiro-SPASM protein [Treponema sp.]|jgi:spiro-SPASM protein|nr:spiro-SPASM protein [Treponema sp.]
MNALTVLYGGALSSQAYEKVFSGKNALALALERGAAFPGAGKLVLLTKDPPPAGEISLPVPAPFEIVAAEGWNKKKLLNTLASLSAGFDLTYFAWADCPFLDPALAGTLAERHLGYAAEYSYADGWPYGFAPEILAPGIAGILAKIAGDDEGPVERDLLFSVIQKDINAFDIETEISPADLRCHRLSLSADSRRNLLLLTRFAEAGLSGASGAEGLIAEKPGLLRTLPRFYPVQVTDACPQSCTLCPYPKMGGAGSAGGHFLDPARFGDLLDRIAAFSGDAVIDLSLWGELSLHPEKMKLIEGVLSRPGLSLVIETSGLAWSPEELEEAAALAASFREGPSPRVPPPLSWIVSLDAHDPGRYREIRGAGYSEAVETAKKLSALFPRDAYVQAVRVKGFEDDIEAFYRFWKERGMNVIIQKYDHFCGFLPELRASDLSPVIRRPCWHLLRDMPVLLDGTVPVCREDIAASGGQGTKPVLGNIFSESPETIWERGTDCYLEQCSRVYSGICAECDEYYTYNF